MERIEVIDSHTGGEPTRVVISGGPDLGGGSLAKRLERFKRDHDGFRSAVVNEPRGSDVLVGALLCEPEEETAVAGLIFFNNVGVLGMCGHGTLGVVETLRFLERIGPGEHRFDTPVGSITTVLEDSGTITLDNVPSYRHRESVTVEVPDIGPITGDVAWGGNWFFLVHHHGQDLDLKRTDELTDFTWRIRQALEREGITGEAGGLIDHIELFAPSSTPGVDSKNFVLCPGRAYDRSPCGTGTSAKLACLFADGLLKEGEVWRQESIVGSVFEGWIRRDGDRLIPRIRGTAHVTAESTLILKANDPFCRGFRP